MIMVASLGVPGAAPAETGPDPVAVFAALEGTWNGSFVGYDAAGRELFRIQATHTYRTSTSTEQSVEIRDVMPDGTIITGRGVNAATRRDDGTLELRCLVEKSNGDSVEHSGRLVTGPDGDQQIVWYTNEPDRSETFREHVKREGNTWIYEINGMGRYGDTLILMHGRYRKTSTPNGRNE